MDKIKAFFTGDRTPGYTDKMPTQVLLVCRAIVGAYLLYNDYTIVGNLMNPQERQAMSDLEAKVFIVFVIIFAVFGLGLVYATIRNYMIGRYVGGKLDLGERPVGEETQEEAEEEAEEEIVVDAISGIEEEEDPERIDGDIEE